MALLVSGESVQVTDTQSRIKRLMTVENGFVFAWLMAATLFVTSWSWATFLFFMVLWLIERVGPAATPEERFFALPLDPIIFQWRLLLIMMALSIIGALTWVNAVGTIVGFALASYVGLASARYFYRNEAMFRRVIITPIAITLPIVSIVLFVLRLAEGGSRATLFALNPNTMASFLLFGAGLCCVYIPTLWQRGAAWVIPFYGVTLLGIFGTDSRGAMVGFASMMVVFFARSRKGLVGVTALLLIAAMFLAMGIIPMRLGIDHARIDLWGVAWEMIKTHPLNGIGINNFKQVSQQMAEVNPEFRSATHAHNLIFQFGAELGVPGLIVLLILLGTILVRAIRLLLTRKDTLSRGIVALICGMLVRDMFDIDYFYMGALDMFFWLTVGMLIFYSQQPGDGRR